MIFVDASALVSIIIGEADANDLSDRLERSDERFCSAISIWETIAALARSHTYAVEVAERQVAQFCKIGSFTYAPIGERESRLALEAYARFGKGRHPAGLNMGDCFAYACAKANDARLLFKGEDFSKTDIAAA